MILRAELPIAKMASISSSVKVSVIIPTFNRGELLRTTLAALRHQDYLSSCLEILVIDDGSSDNTAEIVDELGKQMQLAYVKKTNHGATISRNNGALQASGEVLVFVDDDIELMPDAISKLVKSLMQLDRLIVVGTLLASSQMESTGGSNADSTVISDDDLLPISVGQCFTGLLSIRRADFLALGMFQDPTGGWPNWDDVDFGYRANLAGYNLRRCQSAKAIHHDTAALSLAAASRRWYRASHSVVKLFQKYPGLARQLPMFQDKTPVRLGKDPVHLIGRKLARQIVSSAPIQWMLESLERVILVQATFPDLIVVIRRWILSAQVYRGLRQGITEYGDFQE